MSQKMCFKVNIEDEKGKRRSMRCIAGIEGVVSVALDTNETMITVMGDADPVCLVAKLRKSGFIAELLSVGPAKQEKFEAEKGEKKVGSKCDTENRGRNHYLGVQRAEAVGGFGSMNRATEDIVGSKTRIAEAVAGFGDFTSIEVDIQKGMVTVVGKSVPVSVALKVREMGYRAKLLSLGPATEEEDTDEEHNDDPYPTDPSYPYNHPTRPIDLPYPYHVVDENPTSHLRYRYHVVEENPYLPYPYHVVKKNPYRCTIA